MPKRPDKSSRKPSSKPSGNSSGRRPSAVQSLYRRLSRSTQPDQAGVAQGGEVPTEEPPEEDWRWPDSEPGHPGVRRFDLEDQGEPVEHDADPNPVFSSIAFRTVQWGGSATSTAGQAVEYQTDQAQYSQLPMWSDGSQAIQPPPPETPADILRSVGHEVTPQLTGAGWSVSNFYTELERFEWAGSDEDWGDRNWDELKSMLDTLAGSSSSNIHDAANAILDQMPTYQPYLVPISIEPGLTSYRSPSASPTSPRSPTSPTGR